MNDISYWTAAGYILYLAPMLLRMPDGTVARGEQWITAKPGDPLFAAWSRRTVLVLPKRFEHLVKA